MKENQSVPRGWPLRVSPRSKSIGWSTYRYWGSYRHNLWHQEVYIFEWLAIFLPNFKKWLNVRWRVTDNGVLELAPANLWETIAKFLRILWASYHTMTSLALAMPPLLQKASCWSLSAHHWIWNFLLYTKINLEILLVLTLDLVFLQSSGFLVLFIPQNDLAPRAPDGLWSSSVSAAPTALVLMYS